MNVVDYIKLIGGFVVGALFLGDSLLDTIKWLKRRGRLVRVPGVIVGLRDTRGETGGSPAAYQRAAIFRFTTLDGHVVEAESNVSSFPGPKPGKRVTVIYDPSHPGEAETTGRMLIIRILRVIGMVGGLLLLAHSFSRLP